MSDEVIAPTITLHLSDNPEIVCTDFGPLLEDAETINSPEILSIDSLGEASTGITIANEAINTSAFTAGGKTVAANEGIKYEVTPSVAGTYKVRLRATSSATPRKPALTQPITVTQ